jgi:hypothetical protein
MQPRRLWVWLSLLLSAGCYSGGDPLVGLFAGAPGDGPTVVWDVFAEPLPDIPFPNDIATRPDLDSPTGRRVNASLLATTAFERKLRRQMSRLDGFGTFNPMYVRFASPDPDRPELARLDLERIRTVQRGDTQFADDVVLLINVTRESRTYGDAVVLDFGNGNFPLLLEDEDDFFENDPRRCGSNLIFETYEEDDDGDGHLDVWEDTNQNGTLDGGEDRDGDGRLDGHEDSDDDGVFDHPNLWGTFDGTLGDYDPCDPTDRRDYSDLVTFYEMETDTLWFRPVYPLEERTTYAVVLLRDLVGQYGDPVQSPFAFAHHLQQTAALRPLAEDGLLARYGRSSEDVAFAWSFTSQSVTEGLVKLREGLYGVGPFADLATEYPAEVADVVPMTAAAGVDAYLLRPRQLVDVLGLIFENIDIGNYDTSRVDQLVDTYGAVDYVVAGDYTAPDYLDAGGGAFDLDLETGSGRHQPNSIRFILVVPSEAYGRRPFPVALYCHGYSSLKLEALAFAGGLAKFGIATFAIDAPSHGLPLGGEYDVLLSQLLAELGGMGLVPFFDAIKKDRARDLNHDTMVDPGGDFWTNDMFHTRDIVRQTVLDYSQAIRLLRGFDGSRTWAEDINGDGVANDLAGDFDGDGRVDVGGPDSTFFALGTSMGGINSSILGGLDPAIRAAAPISPGGGLLEVGLRTDLGRVTRAVILPIMGPMVVSRPHGADPRLSVLEWLVNDVFSKQTVPFARIGDPIAGGGVSGELRPGDVVENLATGKRDRAVVNPAREVRAHIAADKYDPVVVRVFRPDGTLVEEVREFEVEVEGFQGDHYNVGDPLVAVQEGLGYRRDTPDLRRLIGLAQMVLEPADPVNWGVRYADPVVVRPEGVSPTNVLFIITLGDMTVPISTGIALARATGIIEYRVPDPVYGKTHNQLLIDEHVVEAVEKLRYFEQDPCHYTASGVNFDIDDLSDGRHPEALPRLAGIVRPPECSAADPPVFCDTSCAPLPPLRASTLTERGIRAARFPALSGRGQHAIDLPDATLPFDPSMFTLNQVGLFLGSGGTELSDHPCLAKNDCSTCAGEPDCPALPPPPFVDRGD